MNWLKSPTVSGRRNSSKLSPCSSTSVAHWAGSQRGNDRYYYRKERNGSKVRSAQRRFTRACESVIRVRKLFTQPTSSAIQYRNEWRPASQCFKVNGLYPVRPRGSNLCTASSLLFFHLSSLQIGASGFSSQTRSFKVYISCRICWICFC